MTRRIEAQLHFWPWSVGVPGQAVDLMAGNREFPFYGSPLISVSSEASLYLPQRNERFLPLGQAFQTRGGKYQLHETPHGVMAAGYGRAREPGGTVVVRGATAREEVVLRPMGARAANDPGDAQAESKLKRTVLAWSTFFDDMLKKSRESRRGKALPWADIEGFILRISEDTDEPRMALIVDIAQRMHGKLSAVVNGARRILLRERRMLPAARVVETDDACLRWLVRQPGETMAQKAAANRERLLGVARRESLDTLENRVLKDFLARSVREGHRYLYCEVRSQPRFLLSKRARLVRGYGHLCTALHQVPHLEAVLAPPPAPVPNYVLQNDSRYSEMWGQYLRLLRREDEEDRLWDWQARTWADVARMLVNFALYKLSHQDRLASEGQLTLRELKTSSVHLHIEQRLGCRVASGSEPGPFVVSRCGNDIRSGFVLEVVHPEQAGEHPAIRGLGQVGGHLFFVLTPLSTGPRAVITLWAVHTAGAENHPPWGEICASAREALQIHRAMLADSRQTDVPLLHAFVVASDMDSESADIISDPGGSLHLVRVATDERCWENAVAGVTLVIENVLGQFP